MLRLAPSAKGLLLPRIPLACPRYIHTDSSRDPTKHSHLQREARSLLESTARERVGSRLGGRYVRPLAAKGPSDLLAAVELEDGESTNGDVGMQAGADNGARERRVDLIVERIEKENLIAKVLQLVERECLLQRQDNESKKAGVDVRQESVDLMQMSTLFPLADHDASGEGKIHMKKLDEAIGIAPGWLRGRLERLRTCLERPARLRDESGAAIMCAYAAANPGVGIKDLPEVLHAAMQGRCLIKRDQSLLVDMSELELMPSARDEAVRRLIGRAKLYTWVGETLLQGKPSKTVIYGRLFASGRDGGESLEKDGVPIRVEDLKQF